MMERRRLGLTVLILIVGSWSRAEAQVGRGEPPRPLILVHVMPWFEAKPTSAAWGWHWTMGHFNPDRVDSKGRREIASHQYPMVGPYDSADPDLIEYHTLLMKIAGVDGVIADWYGNEDFNDYASIHRRTSTLFDSLKRRGLKFAVCYEDRVLKALVEQGKSTPEQAVAHATSHLRFCDQTWFRDPAYLTRDGRPLLLVFGPDYLKPGQWESVFATLGATPAFFTLHERRGAAIGSFAWPPMWASKNGILAPQDLDAYLARFDRQDGQKIAAAFPGFNDIYEEAKVQPSHGYLDPRDGATFRQTLEAAVASKNPLIQVATWNDFGEGTAVEPTVEHGYQYLEAIQAARRQLGGEPLPYQPDDLRLPFRVFQLRKRAVGNRQALDEAVNWLHGGQTQRAADQLGWLERSSPILK